VALYPDRPVILLEIEVTEGTDPTPAAANAQTYQEHRLEIVSTAYDRRAVSPQQLGYLPLDTLAHLRETFTRVVTMRTVASADDTDAPSCDIDLRCAGWTRVSEGASADVHTYVLGSGQGETCTLYHYRNNDALTDSQRTIGLGGRGQVTLSAEAGQPWMIEGERLYTLSGTARAPQGSAYTTAIAFDGAAPVVLEAASVRLYAITDTALYGGGSLGSLGVDGALHSFRLNTNRRPSPRLRANGANGVAGAQLDPDRATLELVLDVNDYSRINLQTARRLGTPLEVYIQCAQRGASGNTLGLLCYGAVVEINDSDYADGVGTATVTLALLYPPDVSDNDPAPGISPTQVATTTTNRGLPVIPSGLVTGLAYLQFRST
jgi:hypothetical protein